VRVAVTLRDGVEGFANGLAIMRGLAIKAGFLGGGKAVEARGNLVVAGVVEVQVIVCVGFISATQQSSQIPPP
jgi:hypothetical protein